jgi:hypothetical protein
VKSVDHISSLILKDVSHMHSPIGPDLIVFFVRKILWKKCETCINHQAADFILAQQFVTVCGICVIALDMKI